jgi:ketosteroid isomerase-like protein
VVTVRGRTGPKELLHAVLVTEWVDRLRVEPSEALVLAARGHHFRRWTAPRDSYPRGRAGYLRWRRALHAQQADELGALLGECGYDPGTIARVQALVRKDGLGHDPDVQVLEDALCLVFLETQLLDVAGRIDPGTLRRVLVKTAHKMSDAGVAAIDDVPLDPAARAVLDGAFAADCVQRYLDALRNNDWSALGATLHPDVERVGPYRDVYRGRDAYASFLEQTISALSTYELVVDRLVVDGNTVVAELSETVDDDGARLRTQEAVVFDVDRGAIARVAVYLQSSERITSA